MAGDGRHKMDVNSSENLMSRFYEVLGREGLRVTPQRVAIYRELVSSGEHPSAEGLRGRLRGGYPNISLDTVNRTLGTFTRVGLAFTVEGSGDAKRYDGEMAGHQHFKCVGCKRIYDIFGDEGDVEIEVPGSLPGGFKILRKTVYFEGLCDFCVENRKV